MIGEELGFVGVPASSSPFFWLTRRVFHIGRQAIALDRVFAGLYAQGIGIWIGGQAFINMGVNLGVLPTKGLTLPLMSYGGSAIVMNLIALAIVLARRLREPTAHARRPRMKAVHWRSQGRAEARGTRAACLFRRRLISRSDVKRAQRAGRSQNRQLMRGGRA